MSSLPNLPTLRPTILLDFADRGGTPPFISCVRPSVASYYDRYGYMRQAAVNSPRIGYDPISGACLGLLVEENHTNTFTYSEDPTNAVWTKGQLSTGATSKSGIMTFTTISETATTNTHTISRPLTGAVAGQPLNVQTFLKQGTRQFVIVAIQTAAGSVSSIRLDTYSLEWLPGDATMTAAWTVRRHRSGVIQISAQVTSLPVVTDGKLTVGFTNASSLATVGNTPNNYLGDTSRNILLGGVSCTTTNFAPMYIPTVATAVTRAADRISLNGKMLTTEYTIIMDQTLVGMGTYNNLFSIETPNAPTPKTLHVVAASNGDNGPYQDVGGTDTRFIGANITQLSSQRRRKSALCVTADSIQWATNSEVSSQVLTSPNVGMVANLNFGFANVTNRPEGFNGYITRGAIYQGAMPNDQLRRVTTI